MKLVFDSFIWLSFFKNESTSGKIKALLEDDANQIFSTSANIYEVYYRLSEDSGKADLLVALSFIKDNSQILPIDEYLAILAAELRLKYHLSAIDAFTYAAAKQLNARLVTGDKDFSKLDDVIMI
ncbi:PIN domain-containing protein [Candidatus Micrarchaeota archaeon]|nr:PIN domain-containing protein [Candidatus Micrarchaeota archaeon]